VRAWTPKDGEVRGLCFARKGKKYRSEGTERMEFDIRVLYWSTGYCIRGERETGTKNTKWQQY
jgi:hypothetical protein